MLYGGGDGGRSHAVCVHVCRLQGERDEDTQSQNLSPFLVVQSDSVWGGACILSVLPLACLLSVNFSSVLTWLIPMGAER